MRAVYGGAAFILALAVLAPGTRWAWDAHLEHAAGVVDPGRPAACAPDDGSDPNTANENPADASTRGTFPWPKPPAGTDPTRYGAYDRTPSQSPPLRPTNWSAGGSDWKLTSARSSNPQINQNPQELCGVEGNSVDTAWQLDTGRPTTVIAILDSGIEWCRPNLIDKIYLNRQALPLPENAAGQTKPELEAAGQVFADRDPYDLNDDGVLNVEDYAADPRIARPFFCGAAGISPEDLIRAFSSLRLPGPKGFAGAIAGWNFLDNSNDPYDDVHYGHGSGEAADSMGAADSAGSVGSCPNCMILPVRVGDSFVATANDFAQGVLFAVDSGASVIQEALGTIDITNPARQAILYALGHGVPIVASAADEEAEHHNLPSAAPHTIVVNSATHPDLSGVTYQPDSYLYLNGCTNYGPNIGVTVESASCSSEATGKSAGIVGLAESEAWDLALAGRLAWYPGLRSATGDRVPLSATEIRELVEMQADDIDFETAAPPAGPPDNYAVAVPAGTTRYPSQPGFDMYFGYGRINAHSILSAIQVGDIPPEAELDQDWFRTFAPNQTVVISGLVGAVRAASYTYQVQVGYGPQPEPAQWWTVAQGGGTGSFHGTLATFKASQLEKIFPAGTDFAGTGTGPAGRPAPDAYTFSIRVVVTDNHDRVGLDRRAEYLHADPTQLTSVSRYLGDSVDAGPALAPIGPGGENVLLVATANGAVHAYLPDGAELKGWPVDTNALPYHSGEAGFQAKSMPAPHAAVLGGVAVGDLLGDGRLEVVAGDYAGYVYAWDASGRLLSGFPVRTNPAFSGPQVRDPWNRVLRGIFQAPALADLEGTGRLDIVASSLDRHVYAWRPDGTPVPGWPRIAVDRSKVKSIDPTTHKVTFLDPGSIEQGTKVLDGPTIGALSGSGLPDVVVGTNEEYKETPNTSIANPIAEAFSQVLGSSLLDAGNSRVYAFDSRGGLLPGWPFKDADWEMGLLPDVGDGTVNTPSLADVDGSGTLRVGAISTVGPAYVINPDGTSYFGNGPDGMPKVLSVQPTGPLSNSPSHPSIPALGSPIFAPLGGTAPGVSFIAPAASTGKALDAALPGQQQPNDNQLDAWSLSTQHFQAAFPQVMNDLEFFDQPIVANVASGGPYIVEGSALADLRAVNAEGQEAPGYPKFTGGWIVNAPAFGAFGDLPNQVLAAGTREGDLYVWRSTTGRCADSGPWPKLRHDLSNTGNLSWTGAAAFSCTTASSFKAGAAEVSITPPAWSPEWDQQLFAPACGATAAQVEQTWPGARPYAFEEPYIDQAGTGRYELGDPFCDANHDGRYDGIWVAGGSGQNKWASYPPDSPNPVSAEAVVFSNRQTTLAAVTVDSIGMFNSTFDLIRSDARKSAPAVQQVFVSTTHDESAPDPIGLWGPDNSDQSGMQSLSTPTAVTSGVDEYYLDWMAQQVAAAIGRAYDSLQPARLRLGVGNLPKNVQSCWSSYPYIDDQLIHVMQAFNPRSGRTIFTLVNGETHVESLAFSGVDRYTHLLSADWPGPMRRALEQQYGGVALEMTGLVGSVETPTVYEPESTVVPQVPTAPHDVPNPNGCHTIYENPSSGTPVTDAYQFISAYGLSMAHDAEGILGHAETVTPTVLAGQDKPLCVQLENNLFVAAFAAHLFPDRPAYADPTCSVGAAFSPAAAPAYGLAPATIYQPQAPTFLKTDVALVTVGPAQLAYSPGEVFPFSEIRGAIDRSQLPFPTDCYDPTSGSYTCGSPEPMTSWFAARMPAKYRFLAGLGQDMIGYLFPPGNFVGDQGETTENPWLAYQVATGNGDHDRFGYGHPDDSESVGPHAGLAVSAALDSLLTGLGGSGADIRPGLFVDGAGRTSISPFASSGFGGAVGVVLGDGTKYIVGSSAAGWVTYEGLPDAGTAGTALPYSVSTGGVSLADGRVILVDVFAGAGG